MATDYRFDLYKGNTDNIRIDQDLCAKHVGDGDPAIQSVLVKDGLDFGSLGNYGYLIGKSKHVKHLNMQMQQNMSRFCCGLAENRSIEMLELHSSSGKREYPYDEENELIELLMPFFSDNQNLERVILNLVGEPPSAVIDAVDACQNLKAIEIRFHFNQRDVYCSISAGKLIRAICRKPTLKHVAFNGCTLSRNECLDIKRMLSAKNCELESLMLIDVDIHKPIDVSMIARGIAGNKSLRHFEFRPTFAEDATALLKSKALENVKLESLETIVLDLGSSIERRDFSLHDFGPQLTSRLKHMPQLKRLFLDGILLEPDVWIGILSTLVESKIFLKVLALRSCTINHDLVIPELASYVNSNASLEALDISLEHSDCPIDAWGTFFQTIHQTTVTEFHGFLRGGKLLPSFWSWLESSRTISVLKVTDSLLLCNSEDWQNFIPALPRSMIEVVNLRHCLGYGPYLQNLFATNSRLKSIGVRVDGLDELQSITNALANPNCKLEELLIDYVDSSGNVGVREPSNEWLGVQRARITKAFVEALKTNKSLKVLHFKHLTYQSLDLDWKQFYSLLSSTDSIAATYDSNHTLYMISIDEQVVLPIDLYSILRLNQNPNKSLVARKKIVINHRIDELNNLVPSMLPEVLAGIGNAASCRVLCQMYGILRKNPDTIKNHMN